MGWLRRDLSSVSPPSAVLRWMRARPLDAALRFGALFGSGAGVWALLEAGGWQEQDWLVYGVPLALSGLLQPDLEPYRGPRP